MKKYILFVLLILFATGLTTYGQMIHRWKPLKIDNKTKIWYDASKFDSVKNNIMDMWLLQMYQPALTFDNINGNIYRSKTLYTINLNTLKYGIKKVYYFDVNNKEIEYFDYGIEQYSDSLIYTYPILDDSEFDLLLQKYLDYLKKENANGK